MGNAKFNCVAILDAIPDGELNTARRLNENLRDIAAYMVNGLQVRYFRIQAPNDLEMAISSLKFEVENHGLIPWLHLEGHGAQDQSGFATADKSYCSWANLKTLVTPLNIATNLNVVIVLATCFGGSFTKAVNTIDRAPVLAIIGPTREITAGQIDIDFPAFYKAFFTTGSLREAITALTEHSSSSLYFRTTAEQFFYDVWASYKLNECTETQLGIRARLLYRRAKKEGISPIPSIGHLKRKLRSEEEGLFKNYRDTYFLCDLFPENRKRFPVTYEQAERHASAQQTRLTACLARRRRG